MPQETNDAYFNLLLKNSRASKKQVALYLDDAKIERLDLISRLFSTVSDSKSFSRNTLIEEAIDKFMAEAEDYLLGSHGIDVQAELNENHCVRFDTVLLSSRGRGFEDTFLGEREPACWYPCRVSEEKEPYLKYIAIYRAAPVCAITHYAKIKRFVWDAENHRKVCQFDGDPIPLPQKVVLGRNSYFFVGTKYVAMEDLLNAATSDDLKHYSC